MYHQVEQATAQVKQQLRERVTKLNRATKQAQMRRRHTKQIEDLRQVARAAVAQS